MKNRFAIALGVALICTHFTVAAQTQETAAITQISTITNAYASKLVVVQGKVSSYVAPTNDRQPYTFTLKDSTGELRIVIWKDTWTKLTFADKLQQAGQDVTARVRIGNFRDNLQGTVDSKDSIALGLNNSLSAPVVAPSLVETPASSSVSSEKAVPISWQSDIQTAISQAGKDKKNILVLFTNPDAENSNYIEGTILKDGRVSNVIAQKYIAVKISMKDHPETASQLNVFRGGVVNIYGPNGAAIKQLTTIHTVDDLLDQIK